MIKRWILIIYTALEDQGFDTEEDFAEAEGLQAGNYRFIRIPEHKKIFNQEFKANDYLQMYLRDIGKKIID